MGHFSLQAGFTKEDVPTAVACDWITRRWPSNSSDCSISDTFHEVLVMVNRM